MIEKQMAAAAKFPARWQGEGSLVLITEGVLVTIIIGIKTYLYFKCYL